MSEASCHCGAVRIEVAERPAELTACNCSLCRRLGTLWAYDRPRQVCIVPGAGSTFPFVQGSRTLAVHHCATTGRGGVDLMAVNGQLMEGREIQGVRVRRLDGAATWRHLH